MHSYEQEVKWFIQNLFEKGKDLTFGELVGLIDSSSEVQGLVEKLTKENEKLKEDNNRLRALNDELIQEVEDMELAAKAGTFPTNYVTGVDDVSLELTSREKGREGK